MTSVLLKWGNLNTHTQTPWRIPCEAESRGQGDASTNQGLKDCQQLRNRGERWSRLPLTASEGADPADTLT